MDKRVMKTRRAIHSAMTRLLTLKPIEEITVTELADAAEINRKTFYNWEKKGDLPVSMLNQIANVLKTSTDKILGLSMGADDYITKPYNPMELTARVKSSLRRYMQLGDIGTISKTDEIKIGGLVMDKQAKSLTVDGAEVRLTATEYKILELLMENAGRVFSAEEIYRKVWNEDAYAVENTVMVHIRHIREKIEIDPKEPRYLKVVWGIGYKVEKIK